MQWINVNGQVLEQSKASIKPADHSYRYGDGLFETMKIINGKILLIDLHFDRLFNGLSLLNVTPPPPVNRQNLQKEIIEICKKNECEQGGRIRFSVSTGTGGLYDNDLALQYIIECTALPRGANELNEKGWEVGLFPHIRKSCDILSNLKSASHLSYAVAARFATENHWNDCFLFNTHDRLCDSTIANVFWVKQGTVYTPPLTEGCIAGVMRRFLLTKLKIATFNMLEQPCTLNDLKEADEIFVTNAIQGIRWIGTFDGKTYANNATQKLYAALFA
jgi:branched-chain amino acid aminotransferase